MGGRPGRGVQGSAGKFFQGLTRRLCASVKGVTRRQRAQLPVSADQADVPPEASHVWLWSWALDRSRGYSELGALAVSYSEMDAWARLAGEAPQPWELEAWWRWTRRDGPHWATSPTSRS